MPGTEKARKAARKSEPREKKAGKLPAAARPPAPAPPAEKQDVGGQLKQQPDARGKFVYCIIEASEPLRFGPLGIGADPAAVHTVNYRDIAAVDGDNAIHGHDPTRADGGANDHGDEAGTPKQTGL